MSLRASHSDFSRLMEAAMCDNYRSVNEILECRKSRSGIGRRQINYIIRKSLTHGKISRVTLGRLLNETRTNKPQFVWYAIVGQKPELAKLLEGPRTVVKDIVSVVRDGEIDLTTLRVMLDNTFAPTRYFLRFCDPKCVDLYGFLLNRVCIEEQI